MTNEELVLSYQRGNEQALSELIENNRGRVFKIANKFYTGKTNSIDIEDLIQEGYMGVMSAAEKYNSNMDYHASFITYANYWIYQKIHRFIIQKNTNDETSLNAPLSEENENNSELQDFIEFVDYGFENAEEKIYLQKLREDLEKVMNENTTLQEREILKLHYGWDCKECTLTYISSIFDITSLRVQQIENKALRKIRQSKWSRIEYKKYYDSMRHNYNTVENKIDFTNKYFKGVV
jgi:RNA polymerase sigma factor, sigma-70 family